MPGVDARNGFDQFRNVCEYQLRRRRGSVFTDALEKQLDVAAGAAEQCNCFIISCADILFPKIIEDILFKVRNVNVSRAPTARATSVDRDMRVRQEHPFLQDPILIEHRVIAASSFTCPICHTMILPPLAHLDRCLSKTRSPARAVPKERPN
jgi:hypothetical protein